MSHGENNYDRKRVCGSDGRNVHDRDSLAEIGVSAGRVHRRSVSRDASMENTDRRSEDGKAKSGRAEEAFSEEREEVRRWVLTLPSCAFDARHHLPQISAIYFLLRNGDCLYVGLTDCLLTRWKSHDKARKLEVRSELRIAFWPIEEGWISASGFEDLFIRILRPGLNGPCGDPRPSLPKTRAELRKMLRRPKKGSAK